MFSRVDRNSVPSGGTLNCTEKGTETKALTNGENSVLEILMKDPYCTSEDIAESIGKSLRTVKRILSSLNLRSSSKESDRPRPGIGKQINKPRQKGKPFCLGSIHTYVTGSRLPHLDISYFNITHVGVCLEPTLRI